jgi:hypothetical protein
VQSLPPYLFAGIERKIAERKAAGRDVISLGIGDPDLPTPAHVVGALAQAAADPATHQYPSNQGELAFREAVASFYASRFGVRLDTATAVALVRTGQCASPVTVELPGGKLVVDVGNPHAVIQSPWPLELVPLHEVGPVIEEHKYFPRKANVEFVKVLGEHGAKVRVWERGVGETRACGTGATATAVALVRTGECVSPVTVELPGGKLVVEVRPDWRVFMTGPAEEIYHGDLSLEFLDHLE